MTTSLYAINKGINKPIEFKGLKAQYIGWLGAGLVMLLINFTKIYISGLGTITSLGIITIAGTALYIYVQRVSAKHGQHGMMKALAKQHIPRVIKSYSRTVYTTLWKKI